MVSKKTTVDFPAAFHDRLARIAGDRHMSVADLVREACELRYGKPGPYDDLTVEERLAALREMRQLNAPVGTPAEMDREAENTDKPGDPRL